MSTKTIKPYHYFTPALLAALIFASNFLNPNIYDFQNYNFAVWFALSIFVFACGWLINSALSWRHGGRIVFSVIIAVSIISIGSIIYFKDYFGAAELTVESFIIYSLRYVTLGALSFFGMAVSEVFKLQKETMESKFRVESYEKIILDAKKEAALEIREAKLKAEQIVREAEWEAKAIIDKKNKIEKDLREFIEIEKELINKYEETENK